MKREKYTKAPANIQKSIMESQQIEDFLPPPEKLILKEKEIKVTLNLNERSVDFFKKNAHKMGVPYQKMIKKVLDIYASKYS